MSASLLSHFQTLARHNRRANRALYGACATLPRVELQRPRVSAFGSILGTLNYMLVVDRTWMDRFTQTAREPPPPDNMLYPDFDELRAARKAEDDRIQEMMEGLKIAFLSCRFRYKDHFGQFQQDGADVLVAHFFNHQTHYRGHVHDMLIQSGLTDLNFDLHRLMKPVPA